MTPWINVALMLACAGLATALGVTLYQIWREIVGFEEEGGDA